ncbi:uracil phosphoribosyltransferase [Roseimarinus sediminis]|jgi:uracil phosphoribosyltransferase|uniref:uracil phosphoribosyltransferase n=1 Tax=Roseimarinus sediminis TaxID=1610899 RepID=UPI003D1F7E3E
MQVINLGSQNSIFNQFIAEIRDVNVQTDPLRFRKNIERIGEIFAYEISKQLDYEPREVQTPLGVANMETPDAFPILATILRAGLPLHQGLLNYFDLSGNAFISAFRKYIDKKEFVIEFEYLASPSLEDKVVVLSDPMLATGSSLEISYHALHQRGRPRHVHLVAIIASQAGVDYVVKNLPSDHCTLWVGAIDPELNEKAYIVPGLGDAGDLAYGEKLDSE